MKKRIALIAFVVLAVVGTTADRPVKAAKSCPRGYHEVVCPTYSFCCPNNAFCACLP